MSRFHYHTTDWHIGAKIVITIVAVILAGYPAYEFTDHNIMMTIWSTLLVLSIPLGIMYAQWYD